MEQKHGITVFGIQINIKKQTMGTDTGISNFILITSTKNKGKNRFTTCNHNNLQQRAIHAIHLCTVNSYQ